jgi:hypothetical protein
VPLLVKKKTSMPSPNYYISGIFSVEKRGINDIKLAEFIFWGFLLIIGYIAIIYS